MLIKTVWGIGGGVIVVTVDGEGQTIASRPTDIHIIQLAPPLIKECHTHIFFAAPIYLFSFCHTNIYPVIHYYLISTTQISHTIAHCGYCAISFGFQIYSLLFNPQFISSCVKAKVKNFYG